MPFRGRLVTDSEALAIDGTVFETPEGVLYAIWSGRPEPGSDEQHLYIALMTDPWTTSGPRFLLSRPELEWETTPAPGDPRRTAINEGPAVLQHDGRIFVSYSANTCFTPDYSAPKGSILRGRCTDDRHPRADLANPALALGRPRTATACSGALPDRHGDQRQCARACRLLDSGRERRRNNAGTISTVS